MRELYTQQLETMKTRLIQMGAMCEDCLLYTSPSPRDS